ncbi:taste receptor type 2 member 1-like [Pygocentrus nattereri]|uniref:taste receptor type 2 member 1-like n=1 Tax=Pygocentrus nattereri TaxID=42514 RepID=UPI0018915F39|nr:taste receptor type 2 member 1-like [Pygocentrus nattereri]
MAPSNCCDFSVSMSSIAFAAVNIPVSIVCFCMNIFFVFCMIFPQQGTDQLKQPLNVLLGSLVGYNTTLQACVFLFAMMENDIFTVSDICYAVIIECICFAMRTSVTSILWLNVFYYCQIVPAQHPPFIWMKKNIRVFIYSALIMDKFFFMFEFSLGIAYRATYREFDEYNAETNFNTTHLQWYAVIHKKLDTVSDVLYADTWIRLAYFLLCLFVMSASSCATVLYLQRHMKSMEESSRSFSSPRLQKQMRVTITGSIQALLYFLCSTWLLVRELLVFVFYLEIDLNGHLFCTVACLYSLGITINLSVGQTVFRQQVIHVLQICLQTLKLGSI